MPKWIGKGVLTHEGKDINHGDEIPATFDKRRLKKLIEAGNVGDIPEKIDPKTLQTDEIKSLEKEIDGLKRTVKSFEKEKAKLLDGIKPLEEALDEYKGLVADQKKAIKALEKENAELIKKAG